MVNLNTNIKKQEQEELFHETIWQKILKIALKSKRLDVCDERRLGGALETLSHKQALTRS